MPRIGLAVERELQPLPQRTPTLRVIDNLLLDVIEADARDEMNGALEIPPFFPIKLQKCARVFEHFLTCFHLDEKLRDFGLDAAVTRDVDFPSRFDADHADVLDARFGAVAWTAGNGELHLVRRIHPPQCPLQFLAHRRRVLRAEAAPIAADASFHRAERFRVRVSRRHAEIVPDLRQVFLLHAKQVDPLAAGHLDCRYLVFVDDVGDAAQVGRRGFATPHPRYDGERAVLLNVRVRALVDEARLRIVFGFVRPRRDQVIVECGTARRASVRRPPLEKMHCVGNRQQVALADRVACLLMRAVGACADRFLFRRNRIVATRRCDQQLLYQSGARAAGRRRFRVLAHVVEREQALVLDRAHDGALGHAVATADFRRVCHRESARLPLVAAVSEVRFAEHQSVAYLLNAAAVTHQLEVPGAVDGVAIQHAADELVVLEHQLLVDAVARIGKDDFFRSFPAAKIARRK